jgi:hypothetical protein
VCRPSNALAAIVLLGFAAPWAEPRSLPARSTLCAQTLRPQSTHSEVLQAFALGRDYTRQLYSGSLTSLWRRLTPELRGGIGQLQGLQRLRTAIQSEFGTEENVTQERVLPWIGSSIYHRVARFSDSDEAIWVQWNIDDVHGAAAGVLVHEAPEARHSRFLDYRTRTTLRLPFEGEWFVYWGGRTAFENYHSIHRTQRFAYDFLIVRNGRTHTKEPSRNESYFCFGEPVLAPAAGTVVTARSGIQDNVPGEVNERSPLGNHVMLDHGNGEFSVIAHLQHRSLAVKQLDRVAAGDVLGRCGNSGRSSEPHVHFHLQKAPRFLGSAGLPAQFHNYCANGERIARGEPRRAQRIVSLSTLEPLP